MFASEDPITDSILLSAAGWMLTFVEALRRDRVVEDGQEEPVARPVGGE